tara:strand:- start:245 stop:985 length:741 start_codon:yes stop_codon:yes gene_type:complete
MRTLIIILSLIYIQSVNGQNNVTELKSFIEKIEKADSILEKIKKASFQNLDVIGVYSELDREIDFGFQQHRIKVLPISGLDLKLNFISKNGVIIYGWISEYKSNSKKHQNIEPFKESADFLEQYLSKHNEFYKSDFDQLDFENQILSEYIVGFGCGFTGDEISKESKQTLKYSENKNVDKLNEFLISIAPELQTLGTIGLLKIGKISDEQKKIIQHLKNRNSEVNTCAGCIYGLQYPFNDMIKRYE